MALHCAQWLHLLLVTVHPKAQQLSVVHGYQVFLGPWTFSLSLQLCLLHDIHAFFSTRGKFWHYLFERKTGIIVLQEKEKNVLLVFLVQNSVAS